MYKLVISYSYDTRRAKIKWRYKNMKKVEQKKYEPQDDDLKTLVKKALDDDDDNAYWFIEEIAKKLKILKR